MRPENGNVITLDSGARATFTRLYLKFYGPDRYDVGIDNIRFRGSTIPEPNCGLYLLLSLLACRHRLKRLDT